MMTHSYVKIGTLLLLSVLVACERALIEPDPANEPVENFNLLWKTVDEKYSFFEYKGIDWDEVYQRYRPRVRNDMNESELFQVMDDMLYELRDGHVNLISDFDVARNQDWYLDYPANFDETILERNYLERDYQIVIPFATKVIRNVGYIRYRSFLSPIDGDRLDQLIDRYRGLSGVIIDIRDNTGGAIAYIDTLATRLAPRHGTEEVAVGYVRYKDGPAHDDFTRIFPVKLSEHRSFDKPVVGLTNRSVYSAANAFAAYMSSLPNVTLVGDVTGGGGGAPYTGELMNGWQFTFSTTQMMNIDQEQIENGVAPDIKVNIDPADQARGRDTILETALDLLN